MRKAFKIFVEYALIFAFGAFLYESIEMMWRGYTFYSMGVLGGCSLVFIGALNDISPFDKMPIWLQMILGAIIITLLELITGLLLNQDYSIWDYRNMPLNFKGLICVPFMCAWVALSAVAIFLQDVFKVTWFGHERYHYYLWFNEKGKIF